jgi:hypothetical protein
VSEPRPTIAEAACCSSAPTISWPKYVIMPIDVGWTSWSSLSPRRPP